MQSVAKSRLLSLVFLPLSTAPTLVLTLLQRILPKKPPVTLPHAFPLRPSPLLRQTNLVCKGGAAALAKCLKTSATLTRLDLSENCLGDAGAVAMAELLFPEGSLVRLELGGNKIGLAGVGALAEALEQAPGLKHLGLGFNQLCHSGVRPLADAALGHLETLDLRGNIMDERAARVLAEGVIESTAITMIDVREVTSGLAVAARRLAVSPPALAPAPCQNPNSREATAILGKAMRDRVRRFKEKQRQAKKLARKERRKYDEPGPLPPMEYYWLEPHTLRALPGNSALARAATRVCAVS